MRKEHIRKYGEIWEIKIRYSWIRNAKVLRHIEMLVEIKVFSYGKSLI